jgi:response regulator RpfG family c-di-GMP phosphodiesterase
MISPATNPSKGENKRGRILIVDDEIELTNALTEMLTKHGFDVKGFNNGFQALELLKKEKFDVLLADLMMPDIDGISVLKQALVIDPLLVGIMMTGQGTVQSAVEAMKSGAFDYLLKPFKLNTVLTALAHSLEIRQLREENSHLREMVTIYELGQLVATSLDTEAILQKTVEAAMKVCGADEASILLPKWEEEELVIAVTGGARETLHGQRVPITGSIAGWVVNHQKMINLQGEVKDDRFSALYPRPEIGLAVSLPMITGKNLVGIVNVNLLKTEHLDDEQIKGLSILASIAAAAVENARLFEQTEKRLNFLSALRTIDQAISSSLDLGVTLNIFLDQVTTQLRVDAAAVYLLNPQTQTLEFAEGRGFHSLVISKTQILLGVGGLGTAALDQHTVVLNAEDENEPDPLLTAVKSAENFTSMVMTPLIIKGETKGVLAVWRTQGFHPDQEWLDYFEAMAGQAAIAIDSAQLFSSVKRSNQHLTLAYNATIEGWSRALDLRDKETEGHTQRVTEMTIRLAESMGLFDAEEMVQIRRGALLHDIGKMGIPDKILLKPGNLTPEEEGLMRKHPEYAYELLHPIQYLRRALDIPLYHHEHWDGSGYPRGLKGEQIPLAARIFSVVDVWDALRSERTYRSGWPEEKVMQYISEQSGLLFDPQVVTAFLQLQENLKSE